LELVPHVDLQAKTFSFVGVGDEDGIIEDGSTKGNARKLSGSYYTDASLVQSLIKTALEPAIERKLAEEKAMAREEHRDPDYEAAILSFRMIDAGSGSGHFLLAGARKLAEKLSEIRLSKNGEVATAYTYRKALRDVITNCIYGVDLNEMAVELARTALWLEGYEPGKPLEFLNHHIKQGNSLVGVFDLKVLNNGIPAAAYTPLTGDDNAVCTSAKKANDSQAGKRSMGDLFAKAKPLSNEKLAKLTREIESLRNDDLDSEEQKRTLYEQLLKDTDYLKNKTACDLYTAAFFAKKTDLKMVPTSEDVFDVMNGNEERKAGIRELAQNLSKEYSFFHWPVEFPEVFERGGFDCVVGNPPWDKVKLTKERYFAQRIPEIAAAQNADKRNKMINALKKTPGMECLFEEYIHADYMAKAISNFVHSSNNDDCRYPLTGVGDVNMYALFAELMLQLGKKDASTMGFVTPTGLITDDSTSEFFREVNKRGILASCYDFENRDDLFPAVHNSFKFTLTTLARHQGSSKFYFFLHNVQEGEDSRRCVELTRSDFALMNPNTLTSPVFRSQEDFKLAKKIYSRTGIFINEKTAKEEPDQGNPWHVKFDRMYDMSNDSALFATEPGMGVDDKPMLPLYEAKMMNQMDHRWSYYVAPKETEDASVEQKKDVNFSVCPRYWVPYTETVLRATTLDTKLMSELRNVISGKSKTTAKLLKLCQELSMSESDSSMQTIYREACKNENFVEFLTSAAEKFCPKYLMGWRNISNATNARTFIASVIPLCGVGHSTLLFYTNKNALLNACLIANMASISLDYVTRLKLGGTNMTYGYVRQFPVLPPSAYTESAINYIVPRVFALTYTATDIVEWARALWNDASVDLRKLILAQHKDLPTGTDIETLAATDFDPATIPPIVFEDVHRAKLRAELDAYFARLYGLSRRDLEYILDPKTVMGDDYPSETFRVLRDAELSTYGEYRTQRLTLEAWDKMN
jgi:hypothetical protein